MAPSEPLCDPPMGLVPEVLAEWHEFWSTAIAGGVTRASVPALRRLFLLKDEAARAHAAYREEPLISGSQGQLVLNPQGRHATVLEGLIVGLEDRFGLSPKACLRLNVVLADAAEAIERTAEVAARAELASQERERADPRLADPERPAADPRAGGGDVDGGQPRPR